MTLQLLTKKTCPEPDWKILANLIERGGLNARDPQLVAQAFTNSTFCWYGFHDGKLIATARAISDLTWASYLADVVVDPDYQGRGYGAKLMDEIAQTLLPFGKIFIYSVCDKVEFYKRYNFHLLTTGMVAASDERISAMRQQGYIA